MVLATAKIEDFDRFWNTFSTKGAAKRKEHGCKGAGPPAARKGKARLAPARPLGPVRARQAFAPAVPGPALLRPPAGS